MTRVQQCSLCWPDISCVCVKPALLNAEHPQSLGYSKHCDDLPLQLITTMPSTYLSCEGIRGWHGTCRLQLICNAFDQVQATIECSEIRLVTIHLLPVAATSCKRCQLP